LRGTGEGDDADVVILAAGLGYLGEFGGGDWVGEQGLDAVEAKDLAGYASFRTPRRVRWDKLFRDRFI
jgi:hypothetical protein